MKRVISLVLAMCVVLGNLPVLAASSSYFISKSENVSIVLTEGYSYSEAKLQDQFVNKEGTDVAVYDFYFEGEDADHFAFHSDQSASNINNYTEFSRGTSPIFYIFFELGLSAKVYEADLVVETEIGTFRSPLSVTVQDPLTMTASSKSYFTGYKNTAEIKEGYTYREISLQDNLYNGEGTDIAIHDFYIEGKDAKHFDFKSDYSAVNINNHTKLSRGASTPFYLFLDMDMPAGVYTADLVVVTAVGTYRSTYTMTVTSATSSGSTTTTPSTGSTTTTPSTGSTTTTPSTGSTTTTPSTGSTTTTPSTGSTTTTPSTGDTTTSTGTGVMGDSQRGQQIVARSDGGFDMVFNQKDFVKNPNYTQGGSENYYITESQLMVVSYDKNYNKIGEKNLTTHLSNYQTAYFNEDYNYLFFNQSNSSESNSVEVMRIVKYDKNWNQISYLPVKGINTIGLSGAFSFSEQNGILYIHLAHTMYKGSDGLNHQANLTLAVRLSDMTLTDSQSSVSNSGFGYVSHSFMQDVIVDSEGYLLRLDNGDAYPRGAYLSKTNKTVGTSFQGLVTGFNLKSWSGSIGDNNTGAATCDLVETKYGYISAYIDSGKGASFAYGDIYNGYITFTPKDNFTSSGTKTTAVTNYAQGGDSSCSAVRLISTGENGGYLLYDDYFFENGPGYQSTLYYATYDAYGNISSPTKLQSDYLPTTLSGFMEPLVVGDKIYLLHHNGYTEHHLFLIENRSIKTVIAPVEEEETPDSSDSTTTSPDTGTTTTPSTPSTPSTPGTTTPSGDHVYAISGVNVNAPTQEQIAKFYHDSAKASIATPVTYSSHPVVSAPYSAGALSNETNAAAVDTINYIRYIAGLDYNVTLGSSYIEKTQAGAFLNAVNGKLTHSPTQPTGMSDELYALGVSGAASSNLANGYGSLGSAITSGWMNDGDDSNIDRCGHRRWILSPTMGQIAFGVTGRYSAMQSFDRSNTSGTQTGVAWPAQNTPTNLMTSTHPWTYASGTTVDTATVKLTRLNDGQVWNFSSSSADGYFGISNGGYGLTGCVIFRPSNVSYNAGDVFYVEISGTVTAKYTVSFFDVENTATASSLTPSASKTYYEFTPSNNFVGKAYDYTANQASERLYDKGVLSGKGENTDGSINFGLNDNCTREEMVVLLLSLLGKTDSAKNYANITHNFTDITPWAAPYIAYAYSNGYTSGLTSTTFGGGAMETTVQQALIFILRTMGYAADVDYSTSNPISFSDSIGLTVGQFAATDLTSPISRGLLAQIMLRSLEMTA